jgi:aspartyl-tRNA(Asn)/glutamyl-tRNA(Gln) amidotransferase subunit B
MFATGASPQSIVDARSLAAVSDDSAIAAEVDRVVAANPDVIAKIQAGNDKSKGFLTGQVMKAMKGQAKPDVVNRLLDERLAAL